MSVMTVISTANFISINRYCNRASVHTNIYTPITTITTTTTTITAEHLSNLSRMVVVVLLQAR